MSIPTVLINTTIDEFKAEGYECTAANVNNSGIVVDGTDVQVVQLTFQKKDTTE